ncbi:MAG: UDP-N-acetylmuramate--L-alanine ligase [Candidatus Sungbacteria bacterium]|nr:UDP-N-acetylmuramate--L-alanine ligase [Candidatus Sungbacteria bacterium]
MKVHFVGIGGIGVSALARYYRAVGHTVSGSDAVPSEITAELAHRGVGVVIGEHTAENIPPSVDRVIHTAAVLPENPELAAARERDIPVHSYAEAIGELTRHQRTIAVSGSHGKSTTTALIALVLEEGYFDPTVIIGTKLREFGDTNFRQGKGPFLVLEADEWNKSFLNYSPYAVVLTNIDAEHLDTYGTIADVEEAFHEYLLKVPKDGFIVANADDERIRHITRDIPARIVWYSQKNPVAETVKRTLKISGRHNLANALAALHLGREVGISEPAILKALGSYHGAWRRFELKGIKNGAYIFADYGHHPREIAATLAGARERFPSRRIWCVYQPHQYARLNHLWNDFLDAFDGADRVTLLPVYTVAGREVENHPTHTSEKLAAALTARGRYTEYLPSFGVAHKYLARDIRAGDVVLFMGAGTIYDLTNDFLAVA